MNRKARQKATSPVECDLYKLLNNSNFGIDCRNNIDSINTMMEHKKRQGKKRAFYEIDQKIDNAAKLRTNKMIVDFCAEEPASIKSFAVKEKKQLKFTTRFLSGKVLMFAKLLPMSFIYKILTRKFKRNL